MAPAQARQFIDTALSQTGPLSLSYTHHPLKWLIREHLLSLFEDFPSLHPSSSPFIQNDGTTVNLLNASGSLPIPNTITSIPLTIWLHQSYPFTPPLVFISPTATSSTVRDNPFVNPSSGSTISPYLETWTYPRSNLADLARNLCHLFSLHLLFSTSSSTTCIAKHMSSAISPTRHMSLVSKHEALDYLAIALCRDVAASRAQTNADIERLLDQQATLNERAEATSDALKVLKHERDELNKHFRDTKDIADLLQGWLHIHAPPVPIGSEEGFEAVDDQSEQVLECAAAELAIDDTVYALDEALEKGVVYIGVYLKRVRALAREQFFHRAKLVKLRSCDFPIYPK